MKSSKSKIELKAPERKYKVGDIVLYDKRAYAYVSDVFTGLNIYVADEETQTNYYKIVFQKPYDTQLGLIEYTVLSDEQINKFIEKID